MKLYQRYSLLAVQEMSRLDKENAVLQFRHSDFAFSQWHHFKATGNLDTRQQQNPTSNLGFLAFMAEVTSSQNLRQGVPGVQAVQNPVLLAPVPPFNPPPVPLPTIPPAPRLPLALPLDVFCGDWLMDTENSTILERVLVSQHGNQTMTAALTARIAITYISHLRLKRIPSQPDKLDYTYHAPFASIQAISKSSEPGMNFRQDDQWTDWQSIFIQDPIWPKWTYIVKRRLINMLRTRRPDPTKPSYQEQKIVFSNCQTTRTDLIDGMQTPFEHWLYASQPGTSPDATSDADIHLGAAAFRGLTPIIMRDCTYTVCEGLPGQQPRLYLTEITCAFDEETLSWKKLDGCSVFYTKDGRATSI